MTELRGGAQTQDGDELLEELTEDFLRRYRAGERPSVEEYAEKHPELANRIRDLDARKVEWKKFHEINFVNIHYRPFDASTWPLADSGLLGPVKLVPMKKVEP